MVYTCKPCLTNSVVISKQFAYVRELVQGRVGGLPTMVRRTHHDIGVEGQSELVEDRVQGLTGKWFDVLTMTLHQELPVY
jgi:hypothetical protein